MAEMESTRGAHADDVYDGNTLDDNNIDEATAADTLKPGAGSGGGDTKAEMLATFTSMLAQLGKEDLSKFFNDAQAVFGPNKAPGAEDKSAANRSTVDMKPSAAVGKGAWKEDIDAMFSGSDEDLSEDFRDRAETVFEAAVNTRATLETVRLEEEFAAKAAELEEKFDADLQEAAGQIFEDVSNKLDQYLDYCIEQWMDDNKIAVENSLRSDIAESFIGDLHNLFTEHYITVPESKVDIVAEMKAEVEELTAKLNESIDKHLELQSIIDEATKDATLDDISEGLAETQVEKLRTLAEGIEFLDAGSYRKKLEIVKEQYFTSPKKTAASTGLITEEIDGTDSSVREGPSVTGPMAQYAQAIAKSVK
jgi:hypothetical protein